VLHAISKKVRGQEISLITHERQVELKKISGHHLGEGSPRPRENQTYRQKDHLAHALILDGVVQIYIPRYWLREARRGN